MSMKRSTNKIIQVPIEKIIQADWNYKVEGSSAAIEKIKASIIKDKSAGILAVREMPKGMYEVIDGNHRIVALQQLGVKLVTVENFGAITKAQAVLVARRRNHQWFEEDYVALAELYKDVVLPEIPVEDLTLYMPESETDIQNIVDLLKADWRGRQPDAPASSASTKKAADKKAGAVQLSVSEKTANYLEEHMPVLQARFKTKDISKLLYRLVESIIEEEEF